MEKVNGKILEGTDGVSSESSERSTGSPSDADSNGGPIQVGDIIEAEPTGREYRDFPNIRNITPESANGRTDGGYTGKRRGRKPGSRNTTTQTAQTTKNLDGIEKLLMSIHLGLLTLTGWPEMALEPDEAKQEADAIQTWCKEYGKVIDPKTMATMNLVGTIGFIEGSRIVAVYSRLKTEAKERPQQTARSDAPNAPRTPNAHEANNHAAPSADDLKYALSPLIE